MDESAPANQLPPVKTSLPTDLSAEASTRAGASVKVGPKDFFMHLLAMVALYSSAISFILLLFDYINLLIPDPLDRGYLSSEYILTSIRWLISTLIVVFPTYVLTTWWLNKSYAATPFKRNLRIRRWLIYFTLFVAALIVIGDFVTLIYNLLEGDITLRFILKIVTVFFAAGSVFLYYFWDVKKFKTE